MKSALILALISLVAAQSELPPRRIVGGYEVDPKFKYPWVTSLLYNNRHSCGGTLVNGNTIVSAAHCVIGADSAWKASFHRHNLNQTPESEGGKIHNVVKRIKHPQYNTSTNANDVAIWKIDAPAGPSTGVVLDDGTLANTDNKLIKVIGWGTTSSGGAVSPVLLEVKVPIFNAAKCKSSAYPTLDTTTQFCAGFPEGGKDSCQGDSGGPIFDDSNNVPTLIGVVSWGRGCALKGYPGVYTRTHAVKDFINANL